MVHNLRIIPNQTKYALAFMEKILEMIPDLNMILIVILNLYISTKSIILMNLLNYIIKKLTSDQESHAKNVNIISRG